MTRAALRSDVLPANLPPRLIARDAAAAYLGISCTKFDELVRDGRMPRPRCIDARRLWDVRELDRAADNLPVLGGAPGDEEGEGADNPFDGVVG